MQPPLPELLERIAEQLERARDYLDLEEWAMTLAALTEAKRLRDEVEEQVIRIAQAAGVTDTEIARRLGLTQSAISKRRARTGRRRWRRGSR
jgi:DNA-directed RNA polymerase specialized sigma subunit